MNKKTIITGFLTLILMGGNVLLATHGNDYSRELEGYESESDVEETKGEQAEDETEEQYWQRMRQEAEEMRHGLEGDDTQASPFGNGLEDTNEEDLIYVVPSPDPSYVAHEPLIAPKGAFDMPRNNLAYIGLGSEMPVFQDQQVQSHQLSQARLINLLIRASQEGNLEKFKSLLGRGADDIEAIIEAIDKSGWTALINAAKAGHLNIVEFLLEHGAGIEAADKYGLTPLIAAAEAGHLNIVEFLLEHGADIEATDQSGSTALINAAKAGHLNIVKFLLKHGADIEAADAHDATSLVLAAHIGHLNIVKLLLKHGANIKATDKYGSTALINAASEGRLEIIEFLLERGADIEATDESGSTALSSALINAARLGHVGIFEFLLNKGAKKPSVNKLLHLFVIHQDLLLFANTVINSPRPGRDSLSTIKLMMTEVFDCEWNLESLLDSGIKNNITYSNFFKLRDIYKFLEEKETTVNALHQSITYKLFESAVLENNIEALKALFEIISKCKIDINLNATNEDGEGLLHIALRHGELEIVQALLESGYAFDLELLNAEGETPLGIALINQQDEIAAYLAHQNETQDIFLGVFGDTSLWTERILQGDHPNPNAREDEPPAKRQRVESGEEDEEDLNESVEDADAQDDQESISAPSRARKTRGLGKFDA